MLKISNKKLLTVWNIIEKIIAYVSLFVVVFLECLNIFVPAFDIDGSELALGLISSSLLVIFAHIEDIKKEISKVSFAHVSTRFNDGLLSIFEKNKSIKSLDIIAHTTKTYIHSIADNDVTIDKVRVLVCRPKNSNTRHYPDENIISSLDVARDQAIETWKDLLRIGKVKELEIRYYEYDPTFYFAIINNQYIHYGIYKIEHGYPGYHLYNMYTLDGFDSEFAYNLLTDYQSFFNHVFSEFSYSDPDNE